MALFLSMSREAIYEFNYGDLEEMLRKRGRGTDEIPRMERFLEGIKHIAFTLRVTDWFARAISSIGVFELARWALGQQDDLLMPLTLACIAVFILVVDVLGRPFARQHAEVLVWRLSRPWSWWHAVFWLPVLPFRVAAQISNKLVSGGVEETAEGEAEDDIMAAVSMGEATGSIEEEERDMIEGVLSLDDIVVERLMTPRTEMDALNREGGVAAALEMIKEKGHSRLPVYEGNRDNITGVLYAKDLIGLNAESEVQLQSLLRKPLLIPASKLVGDLLSEFRRNRVHFAIVLDEYGGTAGLITIEDIIEEVFGNIDDEYDTPEQQDIQEVGQHCYEINARMRVDEINEHCDCNLPESDLYESVGGLLTTQLGHIPREGAEWEHEQLHVRVLEATDRRIVRVRLEHRPSDSITDEFERGSSVTAKL